MNQVAILYPVFAQVLLTFTVYGLLATARARAVAAMTDEQRRDPALMLGRGRWPDDAEKRAANQRNQFELPVLFYAVVAFTLITRAVDTTMIVLAWLFVLSRVVHAAVHLGPNKIQLRGPAFGVGFVILAIMWVKLALHVLSGGLA
jgi:hypothetical protein